MQLDAPAADQEPAAQLTHAVAEVAPVAADAVPAAHGVQLDAPAADQEPAAHRVQLESLAVAHEPATHESEACSVKPPMPPPSPLKSAQLLPLYV